MRRYMLVFWGENQNEESCYVCGSPRWVSNRETEQLNANFDVIVKFCITFH